MYHTLFHRAAVSTKIHYQVHFGSVLYLIWIMKPIIAAEPQQRLLNNIFYIEFLKAFQKWSAFLVFSIQTLTHNIREVLNIII